MEYVATGGARWGYSLMGSVGATWPFATLLASPDGIQIDVDFLFWEIKSLKFNRQEIVSINRYRNFFNDGITIKHTKKDYPPFIGFGNFNFNLLKEKLHKFGYEISET